jgi:uroporphyrin-III C-methyltransferase
MSAPTPTTIPPSFPEFAPGSVWLVGAGPGDPGLVTLLAAHALAHADVVVHDALVDPGILAMIRPGARLEAMGKRGGRASPRQGDINVRLIELAQQNLRVLRLKGGDPFVFGRGAEEALALTAAQIPFRVVPGVTAGIGGLAYAGIPVTARDINSAVAFVTGHGQEGTLPTSVDWESLARAAPVLVFYMALRQLDEVTTHLMAAGRTADEPVAVVSRAATPRQFVLESTLGRLVADVAAAAIEPPAILVIGKVVELRRALEWWHPTGR